MLAMADRNGYVGASIGGLAHMARVSREKTEEALKKFLSPDPDSRSPDFGGRRIEEADRGWLILNHSRYRDMRDEEARRTYFRDQKRKSRAAQAAKKSKRKQPVQDSQSMSTHAEADTECAERMLSVSTFEAPKNISAEKLEREIRTFDMVTGKRVIP